jgi:endoribonuclease Dicer
LESRRPRVFGMTASPVTRRGVRSSVDCGYQLSTLEITLHSKVYTLKDREEVETHVPTAMTREKYYNQPDIDSIKDYRSQLEALLEKVCFD